MQRVRMKIHITGFRNGEPWPQVGGELDLPDNEATDMAGNGYVEILGEATGAPADDGLEQLAVRKLRALARDAELDVPKDAGKPELVAALRAHQAAQAEAQRAAAGGDPDGGSSSSTTGDPGGSTPGAGGSDGPPTGKTTPATGHPGASTGTGS